MKGILDGFLKLQKADGSFARKYKDDGADVDGTGGSTPSSTSALVMGYRYFGKKQYLEAARKTIWSRTSSRRAITSLQLSMLTARIRRLPSPQ